MRSITPAASSLRKSSSGEEAAVAASMVSAAIPVNTAGSGWTTARLSIHGSRGRIQQIESGSTPRSSSHTQVSVAPVWGELRTGLRRISYPWVTAGGNIDARRFQMCCHRWRWGVVTFGAKRIPGHKVGCAPGVRSDPVGLLARSLLSMDLRFVVPVGASNQGESAVGRVDDLAIPSARPGRSPSALVRLQPAIFGCGFSRKLRVIDNGSMAPTGTAPE